MATIIEDFLPACLYCSAAQQKCSGDPVDDDGAYRMCPLHRALYIVLHTQVHNHGLRITDLHWHMRNTKPARQVAPTATVFAHVFSCASGAELQRWLS